MPIQGSLQELNALEALQLIGTQRKTTTLKLQANGEEVQLHFREGLLVASHRKGQAEGEPFLDALVAFAHISPAEALQISEQVASQRRDLWTVVCELPHLTRETCERVYQQATESTIDRVLLWDRGRFAMLPPARVEAVFSPGLSVDSILLEAMRRLDETASWKQGLLPPSSIPCLSTTEELYVSSDPLRRAVLRQVDGRRNLGEIVTATRLGEYDIYATIAEGIEAGSIQILAPADVTAARSVPAREVLRRWPAVLVLAVLLAAGAGGGWLSHRLQPDRTGWEQAVLDWEEIDLRRWIEVHRHRHGTYPLALSALQDEKLPISGRLGERWAYRRDAVGYTLIARSETSRPATGAARADAPRR